MDDQNAFPSNMRKVKQQAIDDSDVQFGQKEKNFLEESDIVQDGNSFNTVDSESNSGAPTRPSHRRMRSKSFQIEDTEQSQKEKQEYYLLNQKNLNILKPQLKIQEQAPNEFSQQENCCICQQKVSFALKSQNNNCRLCGKIVCQQCAVGQLNGMKICDFCFVRVSNQDQENKNKKFLQHKEERIKEMEANIKQNQQTIQDRDREIKELSEKLKIDREQQDQIIQNLEKQKTDLKSRYEIQNQNQKLLAVTLQNERGLISKAENQNKQLRQKKQSLLTDIERQEEILKGLQRDLKHFEENQSSVLSQSIADDNFYSVQNPNSFYNDQSSSLGNSQYGNHKSVSSKNQDQGYNQKSIRNNKEQSIIQSITEEPIQKENSEVIKEIKQGKKSRKEESGDDEKKKKEECLIF